jgi:hypothetical protein
VAPHFIATAWAANLMQLHRCGLWFNYQATELTNLQLSSLMVSNVVSYVNRASILINWLT